jgi:hypothetical protein
MDLKFKDCIGSTASNGGENAADHLYQAAQVYLSQVSKTFDGLKIFVKVYANVEGRASALVREQKISEISEFRSFVAAFNNRLPFCDFVDVGYGKERADNKLRGKPQYTENVNEN